MGVHRRQRELLRGPHDDTHGSAEDEIDDGDLQKSETHDHSSC